MNNNWKSLDEIIKLAEENPNQNIWCISMDGRVDFMMTASEIKKTIGNFDWTGVKFTIVNADKNSKSNQNYIQKAIPKTIKFSSRASIKIKDSFYTFEYGEERQIDNFDEVNLDKEKQLLIDDCNKIVDNQIEEVVKMFTEKN